MNPKILISIGHTKELSPDPQNCTRDGNFKTTAIILENHYLWELENFRKIHWNEQNFALANVLKSFLFELWEPINKAHNNFISMTLGLKCWFKLKKCEFWDIQIVQLPNFVDPWAGPKTFFIGSHISQLEFWYPITPTFYLHFGDFKQ